MLLVKVPTLFNQMALPFKNTSDTNNLNFFTPIKTTRYNKYVNKYLLPTYRPHKIIKNGIFKFILAKHVLPVVSSDLVG